MLRDLHTKHIINTAPYAIVTEVTVLFCHLTNQVSKEVCLPFKVYITTKVLKHMYDKRPAQEYDFILTNLESVVTFPDHVYKNKDPKRGDYCFVKKIEEEKYFCALETGNEEIYIVTVFKLRKENYLKNYELLWSWKDGEPSS